MTTQPQEFPNQLHSTVTVLWSWFKWMEPYYKANYQISTNPKLICAPTSTKQPLRDQEWPSWAQGHHGEFLVQPSAQIAVPALPADGKAELVEPRGALGSPWSCSGSTWSCRKHNPSPEREPGRSSRTSSSRGISALPFCSTRESWEPSESSSSFTWIRMFCFSPASDEFELTFYADRPDLKQLYLESRFHCRHSCCMTDATVVSQLCFQCLQQLHPIPLPDIKCTFILINGKKINLWGKWIPYSRISSRQFAFFPWIQNQVSKVLHWFLQYRYLFFIFFIKRNHLCLQSLAFSGYWWNSQTNKKIKLSVHQWISDSAPSVQLVWWRFAATIIHCIKAQNILLWLFLASLSQTPLN